MIVYRAITHNKADLRLDSLGLHYSTAKQSAYPYGDKIHLGYYYLYTCEIKLCDIDNYETAKANKEWPHEKEIVLKPGSEVLVTSVERIKMPCQTLLETINLTFKTKA